MQLFFTIMWQNIERNASFFSVLSPDGNGPDDLKYSTVYGGSDSDVAMAAQVGPTDYVLTGPTWSDDLATPGTYDPVHDGGSPASPDDGWIARFDLCPDDIDDSGEVAVTDLVMVILAWGPCAGCPEDVNADGVVDVLDLVQVILSWGPCAWAGS